MTWEEPRVGGSPGVAGQVQATFSDYTDFHDRVLGGGTGGVGARGLAPRLTKAGYSTTPPIATLERMAEEGQDISAVPNFAVFHEGMGSIRWMKPVDLRGADLDKDVTIGKGFVIVYESPETASVGSNDDGDAAKPPVGQKLNVPALVTLEGVYPSKSSHMATPAKRKAWEEKVEKKTTGNGTEFVGYSVDTGVWAFKTSCW